MRGEVEVRWGLVVETLTLDSVGHRGLDSIHIEQDPSASGKGCLLTLTGSLEHRVVENRVRRGICITFGMYVCRNTRRVPFIDTNRVNQGQAG